MDLIDPVFNRSNQIECENDVHFQALTWYATDEEIDWQVPTYSHLTVQTEVN